MTDEEDDSPKLETHLAIVLGKPGTQGSKKPVKTKDGRWIMLEASQKADEKFTGSGKAWRQELITEMGNDRPDEPYKEAVCIKVIVYVPRPQSHFKSNGSLKPGKPRFPKGFPDLDKILRGIGDAAEQSHWIANDNCIAEWRGNPGHGPQKLYMDDPSEIQRTVVAIWSLEQEWLLSHPQPKRNNLLDLLGEQSYNGHDQKRSTHHG